RPPSRHGHLGSPCSRHHRYRPPTPFATIPRARNGKNLSRPARRHLAARKRRARPHRTPLSPRHREPPVSDFRRNPRENGTHFVATSHPRKFAHANRIHPHHWSHT